MTARRVAADEHELLAEATSRTPLRPADGLSGVPMERVVIGGQTYVAKWLGADLDWVSRVTGDTVCRPVLMWERGLYDRVAPYVDPAVVAASRDHTTGRCVLLMDDVSEHLVEEGANPLTLTEHETFVAAMAAMHAGLWGAPHEDGLCTPRDVYHTFSLSNIATEAVDGVLSGIPAMVPNGWAELERLAPRTAAAVLALTEEPEPLARALAETPQTLVHNDWKGGNLGRRPDGRTILLDWAFPGAGAGCVDLAWYLAVNCDRLPVSKQTAITTYRDALEHKGIDTAGWFERQLELALLGGFVLMGWSKTGNPVELAWWVDRVTAVAEDLLR